jgi:hypothetical protein
MALAEADAAVRAVADHDGDAARFLRELARYVVDRVS